MTVATITEGTSGSGTLYTGVLDTRIIEVAPTSNYSTSQTLLVESISSGDYKRSLLQFTGLSNITGPVTVSAASLFLRCSDATNATNDFDIHRVKVANTISQATWNEASTGVSWATAGAYSATDVDTTPAATASNVAINTWAEFTGSGMASLVEGWINGTITNYGALVKRNSETNDSTTNEFLSSQWAADASLRPYLVVTYTAGGGGPTVTEVSSNSATEGTSIVHTVTLSAAVTGSAASYAITLAGGTATGGGTDYTSTLTDGMFSDSVTVSGGNISVPVSVSTFTVTVSTAGDTIDEANETYTLTIGSVSGTGTINDDDAAPAITVGDAPSVTAGSPAIFTISLDRAKSSAIAVDAACVDGTLVGGVGYTSDLSLATISNDVTFGAGALTIPAGVTSFTVSIPTT